MSAKKKPAAKAPRLLAGVVASVPVASIRPDPDQPRKAFDEKALAALTDNIRERGIQQPILVRSLGIAGLQIVDGERRWRAAKLAKLKAVPVLLVEVGELDQLRLDQVSVNQLREQLTTMELARVLRGLRDAKKAANEIAATMAKQGYPAMKPKQIDELVALTDLPAWLQNMVDAEQIEPTPAGQLAQLLPIPGVEKALRKDLAQLAGYRGKLTSDDVKRAAAHVLDNVGADLGETGSWYDKPVLFDWRTRCKGCEHLVRWSSTAYCVNAKLFAEHQAEAKAAGLGPGGKRPEAPKTGKAAEKESERAAEAKAEQREQSLVEKARDYLHRHLVQSLANHVASFPRPRALIERIVTWQALGRPGTNSGYGMDRPAATDLYHARNAFVISLEMLTAADDEAYQRALEAAAIDAVYKLPWRETHALSRQLWGNDLHTVWSPHKLFLDLLRKPELIHMAKLHGVDLPEGRKSWEALKGDEIKLAMLAQAEKILRPAILADLYQGEVDRPYVDGSWDDDEDDEEPVYDDLEPEPADLEDAA